MNELNKIFDVVPIGDTFDDPPLVPIISDEKQPEDIDFEFVRANYYAIIQQGSKAIEGALKVANESDNPRAFEVVGGLLKHMADINRQLIQVGDDTQKVKVTRKTAGGEPIQATEVIHNTAVFFGNSGGLNAMIDKDDDT